MPFKFSALAIVGGEVNLDGGQLTALGGRVELGGIAGAGTVGLNIDGNNLRLGFPNNLARADVSLTNGSVVDVSADEGEGSIAINAQNLDILGESFLIGGINSVGTQAGDITLDATNRMTIANSSILNDVGNVSSQATGNTGNINIKAGSLSLNNAMLSSSTYGKGNAGRVFLQANDSVAIVNSSLSSDVNTQAEGSTGGVNINAGSIKLTDSAKLSASLFGKGSTAGVFVQANNSVGIANSTIDTQVGEIGAGNGGDINIHAGEISLTNSTLDASISGQVPNTTSIRLGSTPATCFGQ